MTTRHPDFISTYHGGSGHFAVHMRWYADMQGYDVEQTGLGRYATAAEAEKEGREWAEAEEIQFIAPNNSLTSTKLR